MPRFEPSESATTVDYAALSTIPGLMLERTGSGAGTTITPATSVDILFPESVTLANVGYHEFWMDVWGSTDGQNFTLTLILADDSELTTGGYNQNTIRQLADGTPAIFSAESYAAASIFVLGTVSNVDGEGLGMIARSMRPNGTLSHKRYRLDIAQFRGDDDVDTFVREVDVLTAQTIQGFRIAASSGNVEGFAGIRAMLTA